MSHTCGCGAGCKSNTSPITAEQTVEDVSHQSPGALAVLKAKGINHCCGAHLTLREAAAAAGTSLDDLLEALGTLEGKPA
jgi:iron-sulfur cluster repair protein YtfE (RIC family)